MSQEWLDNLGANSGVKGAIEGLADGKDVTLSDPESGKILGTIRKDYSGYPLNLDTGEGGTYLSPWGHRVQETYNKGGVCRSCPNYNLCLARSNTNFRGLDDGANFLNRVKCVITTS